MDRRRFLSLGALAGLSAGVTMGARRLFAQQTPGDAFTPYEGKFFLLVNASGGWDPTMVCDPKGGDINRGFTADQFGHQGEITYAPVRYANIDGADYSNQQFFEKFGDRLLVMNGVDMRTNNHDTGTRFTWSGHLENGYPPFAALAAAALAPSAPLAFLSNGGYEYTDGVAPLTRLNGVGTLARIAYPNRPDTNNAMRGYHTENTMARIRRVQNERLASMGAAATLPTIQVSMRQLLATRGASNVLDRMMQFLPGEELNRAGGGIYGQGLIALAAYQAGITVAANLNVGGFDTHGNHDQAQAGALGRLLKGVDQLLDRIDMLGLRDRVVVMVGSDFGRTPQYNMQNGKDHWAVTSVMAIGGGIRGNRVIGASDAGQRPRGINLGSLTPDDSSQTKLTPLAIHRALRRFAGIDGHDVVRRYPITGEDMNLFG